MDALSRAISWKSLREIVEGTAKKGGNTPTKGPAETESAPEQEEAEDSTETESEKDGSMACGFRCVHLYTGHQFI